jgi:predicted MPP superfamily phosphohydrolase
MQIHALLDGANPHKTLVLHGGDFVCSSLGDTDSAVDVYQTVLDHLFYGLSEYSQFGIIGNHDVENTSFPVIKKYLEDRQNIKILQTPDDVQNININGANVSIHGMHTLADRLHTMGKIDRNREMDRYIDVLNTAKIDCNIVLLHNPDGLEFLLQRLRENGKKLLRPTLFLAGHTHGAMFDLAILRHIGLMACKTQYGRYKGWY